MKTEKQKQEHLNEALETIKELQDLLTDRIADLHQIKGMMQSRHAYCYYRDHVYRIRELIKKAL